MVGDKFKLMDMVSNHRTSKKDNDVVYRTVIYNIPKSILNSLAGLGSMLGLNNRSRLVRFLFKYLVDSYSFLLSDESVLYCFIDYSGGSSVPLKILEFVDKFDSVEVVSVKFLGGGVFRMLVCFSGDVGLLNGCAKGVIECDGVLRVRFVGF